MSEYKFEDITKFSVIEIPEGVEIDNFSEGKYEVHETGYTTWGVTEPYISLLYEDSWGECDPYLEKVTKSEFLEEGCKIVSVPDDKTKSIINDLDNLIVSMNNQAKEIESKAKEAGLNYDIVVLSDVDDLATWRSSRC